MGVPSRVRTRTAQHAWDLLVELVKRDLKIRYKRSTLGIAWSLLNPFFQLLIFTFIFSHVLPLNIPHYASFVFTGLLAWTWFSSAVLSAPGAIAGNPELVRRPGFPVAALPVLTVASSGIPFLLALPVLFVFILVDKGQFGLSLAALPLLIALEFLIILGATCIIAASHVRFRDTSHLVSLAVMIGFYATPVFYSASAIPKRYHLIYDLNPIAVLFNQYRKILLYNQWPNFTVLFGLLLFGLVLLAMGYLVFEKMRTHFAEEL